MLSKVITPSLGLRAVGRKDLAGRAWTQDGVLYRLPGLSYGLRQGLSGRERQTANATDPAQNIAPPLLKTNQ